MPTADCGARCPLLRLRDAVREQQEINPNHEREQQHQSGEQTENLDDVIVRSETDRK